MDVSSLNQKHEEILHKYVKFVQGTAYTATEGYDSGKFLGFNEIIANIITYTNSFNNMLVSSNRRTEWAYMTPNLMLYATIGFLEGVKNDGNSELIDELSEDLFETTVDFVGETTDILDDIQQKEEIQRKILTNQKKQSEHNN
jgi:hypothetical protein|tara:strand:- start:775 stop:1203 length:429 start_codon:yes stop_codon:yes gene_type:complete